MKASFNISSQRLDLSYEPKIQELFLQTVDRLRNFMGGGHVRRCELELQASLAQGLRFVERLAQNTIIQTTSLEADCALDLVSFSSRYLAVDRASAELLARVIVTLAKITPCPCPGLENNLPPPERVFQTTSVPAEIRELYGSLRVGNGFHVPHLFVFQMYELWFHLRKISSPSLEFRALIAGLDAHTLFFRATMSHLAHVDFNDFAFKADE